MQTLYGIIEHKKINYEHNEGIFEEIQKNIFES